MSNSKRKFSRNKVAKSQFIHTYGAILRAKIVDKVNLANTSVLPERRVSLKSAIEVANRDLAKTLVYQSEVRVFSALRSVDRFISLATQNKQTESALKNSDLLAVGHPASTRSHLMSASSLRHARALWLAADSYVSDDYRALVASAHSAAPGSTERLHAFTRLSVAPVGAVPVYLRIDDSPITAAFGLGLGGNSSAARSLRAKLQRRDRRGRFAEMGGGWMFNLRMPDGVFRRVSGRVVGQSGTDGVEIEVRDSRHLPNGVYTMPSSKGEAVKAILPSEALKGLPDVDVSVGTDDVYADYNDLLASRMEAPSGWSKDVLERHKGGAPATVEWTNNDTAYSVYERLDERGARTGMSLHRGLDDSSVGDGDDWGDVQQLVDKDQPEYIKELQKAEADRIAGEKPEGATAPKPAAPVESTEPQFDEQLQPGFPFAEDQVEETGPWRLGSIWTDGNGNDIFIADEDGDAAYEAKRDGFYDTSVRTERGRLKRSYRESTGKTATLPEGADRPTLNKYLNTAQHEGHNVRFMYNGKPRLFQPSRHYKNKEGKWNVVGWDLNQNKEVTFTLAKIEGIPSEKPKTEAPRVEGPEQVPVPPPPPSLVRDVLNARDMLRTLDDAMINGTGMRFNYSGKDRTFYPKQVYQNPKNGKWNVKGLAVDETDGSEMEKTFTIAEMRPVKNPSGGPALPKELPPLEAARPRDLKGTTPEELESELAQAIENNETVRLSYGGTDRIYRPERIYDTKREGKPTKGVSGESVTDNGPRSFFIDRISPSSMERLARSLPKSDESEQRDLPLDKTPEVKPGGLSYIPRMEVVDGELKITPSDDDPRNSVVEYTDIGDVAKLREVTEKAISDGGGVVFNYPDSKTGGDKPRFVKPTETYFNPKNGNTNVVGYSVFDEEDRTFALDRVKDLDELAKASLVKSIQDVIENTFLAQVRETGETSGKAFDYFEPTPEEKRAIADKARASGDPRYKFDKDGYVAGYEMYYIPEIDDKNQEVIEYDDAGLPGEGPAAPGEPPTGGPGAPGEPPAGGPGEPPTGGPEGPDDSARLPRPETPNQGTPGDPSSWREPVKEDYYRAASGHTEKVIYAPEDVEAANIPSRSELAEKGETGLFSLVFDNASVAKDEFGGYKTYTFSALQYDPDFPDPDDDGVFTFDVTVSPDGSVSYSIDDGKYGDSSSDAEDMGLTPEQIAYMHKFVKEYGGPDLATGGPGGPGEPPTGGPTEERKIRSLVSRDADGLLSEIKDAIERGDTISFTYHGKPRVFRPERTYYVGKTKTNNVVGFSETDGAERTFKIDNFDIPPEPEEVADEVRELQSISEAEFDRVFDVPPGGSKIDIFDYYPPKGRTTQASTDYTDDPDVLSSKFSTEQLAKALAEAVLPDESGSPSNGSGSLEFNGGPEEVPGEAIFAALSYAGIAADELLAGMYDGWFARNDVDPPRADETNADRVARFQYEMQLEPESSLRSEIPGTERLAEMLRAVDIRKTENRAERAGRVATLLQDHVETNEKLKSLIEYFERQASLEEVFDGIYDLSESGEADKDDNEAFEAMWGVLMSIDGGDSLESIDDEIMAASDFQGWRVRIYERLLEKYGDPALAKAMYESLVERYGGYPEFVQSKEDIINGKKDLSESSLGAGFYRLIKAAGKPNDRPLWRVITVRKDDPALAAYLSEGSTFYIDASSWTKMDVSSGDLASALFMRNGGSDMERVVFEALPGDLESSVDISGMSWFEGEGEVIGAGHVQVVSVRQVNTPLGPQTVVQVRRVASDADAASSPPAPSSGYAPVFDISDWKKVGGQTGSNPGGFYEDSSGNRYYVKIPRSTLHAENEILAGAFYTRLGVPSAVVGFGYDGDDVRIVSVLVPGADTDDIFNRIDVDSREVIDEEYADKLREDFVIDAWLSGYDVIGYLADGSTNVVTDANGNPVRVDPGGSMLFSATGRVRGAEFGKVPSEFDDMRSGKHRWQEAIIFEGTTDEQLQNGARKLRDMTPSLIDSMVDSIVSDPDAAAEIKEKLKARRQWLLDKIGVPEGADDPEMFPDPEPIVDIAGYEAQDLLPGDVTKSDSFVIEKIFTDEETPKGKVSVQGYYPGHESQRKEWNANTVIDVARGGTIPPKGDKPALHRPRAPRKPSPGAFTGSMLEALEGVDTWGEAADVIRNTPMVFIDYETTGFASDDEPEALNRPIQVGAVRVVDGRVVERFNMYMNPETHMTKWSRENLKKMDGTPVTDEWLAEQPSMKEAHEKLIEFIKGTADFTIIGGQYLPFDLEVLTRTLREQGLELEIDGTIDSKDIAAGTLPKWSAKKPDGPFTLDKAGKRRASNSLGPVAEYLGVSLNDWHRADADAEASWNIIDAMLTRAVENPDTPVDILDVGGAFDKKRAEDAFYVAEREQYEADIAEYEAAKAIAAAWNCGGSGITAAVGGDEGPCDVPQIDDLIDLVRRSQARELADALDPDGVVGGSTSDSSSMADSGSIDRVDKDGVDVKDPYAGEKFPPTEQQRAIVDAVLTGQTTVARALAGTGKTSTLQLIARRLKREQPGKRIIYVAFNKSIQLEAAAKMPDNVESRTADSIAYQATSKSITSKMNNPKALTRFKDIVSHFGISPMMDPDADPANPNPKTDMLSAVDVYFILRKAINEYTISADDKIGPQHFKELTNVPPQLVSLANDLWDDLTSPDGVLKVTNSHITKMWALSRPDLSSTLSGVKYGADVIFFDEAQDINPVLGKVIADQKIQVVYVGDSNQAIYGFRGAVDQLDQITAPHDLPLTKSWRFGPQVAGIGNRFLALLGARDRIEGAGPAGTIVPARSMTDADAVLVRTNGGAIKAIFEELNRGRKVGVTKNYKDDLQSFNDSARWLKEGGDKPKNVHDDIAPYSTWDELVKAVEDGSNKKLKKLLELIDEIGFDGIDDLLKRVVVYSSSENISTAAASTAEMPSLGPDSVASGASGDVGAGVTFSVTGDTIVLSGKTYPNRKAIKKAGFKWDGATTTWRRSAKTADGRLSALENLQKELGGGASSEGAAPDGRLSAPENLQKELGGGASSEGAAPEIDVVITTAHRAKGLEWDKVRIGGDFWGPKTDPITGDVMFPADEELKLDYVAVTRAKKTLDPGSLDWVYDHTEDADELPRPATPSSEEDEVPPPPPPPAPAASDTLPPPPPGEKKTDVAAPEPEPTPGLSGVSETPDEMAPEETTPTPDVVVEVVEAIESKAPRQDSSVEDSPGETTRQKLDESINSMTEYYEEILADKSAESFEKKQAKIMKDVVAVLEKYRDGELSRQEALDAIAEIDKKTRDQAKSMSAGDRAPILSFLDVDLAEAVKAVDGTFEKMAATGQTVEGKDMPAVGSGAGFSKEGIFLTPGMRVRDKWGYAGTLIRYKKAGDFNYVYIAQDVDHRDPAKVKKDWGPGMVSVKKTDTLTVIGEKDDNSPWLPQPGKEDKGPVVPVDEQIKPGDDDDLGYGVKPPSGPDDDEGGGESGEPEAGTTEALRENIEEKAEEKAKKTKSKGKQLPKVDAPPGAVDQAAEDTEASNVVQLKQPTTVFSSVFREKDDFLTKLKADDSFVIEEPVETVKDRSAALEKTNPNNIGTIFRIFVPKGMSVTLKEKPKQPEKKDKYAELLEEFGMGPDPYADIDFTLPAGTKYEIAGIKKIARPVTDDSGPEPGFYREYLLMAIDPQRAGDDVYAGSTAEPPVLVPIDGSDADAASTEPNWQIDYPSGSEDIDDELRALYKAEGFVIDEFSDAATPEEQALINYQNTGFAAINSHLRFGEPDAEKARSLGIDDLDRLIDAAPVLPRDVVLYRVVRQEMRDIFSSLEVGDLFVDPGYTSTSTEHEGDFADLIDFTYEIYAPKGTKGISVPGYLGMTATYGGEQEFLIARGTTFRVVSKREDDDGGLLSIRFAVVEQSTATKDELASLIDEQSEEDAAPTAETAAEEPKGSDDLPERISWGGGLLIRDDDGVYVAQGVDPDLHYSVKEDSSVAPVLPIFFAYESFPDMESGEGHYTARSGNTYWGKYGAGGVLVKVVDTKDGKPRYLLAKRAGWVSGGGGKWAYPGGAYKDKQSAEDPIQGAYDELSEELGIDLENIDHSYLDTHDNAVEPDWHYKTVIVEVSQKDVDSSARISDNENSQIGLFTRDEILEMASQGELHPSLTSAIEGILDLAEKDKGPSGSDDTVSEGSDEQSEEDFAGDAPKTSAWSEVDYSVPVKNGEPLSLSQAFDVVRSGSGLPRGHTMTVLGGGESVSGLKIEVKPLYIQPARATSTDSSIAPIKSTDDVDWTTPGNVAMTLSISLAEFAGKDGVAYDVADEKFRTLLSDPKNNKEFQQELEARRDALIGLIRSHGGDLDPAGANELMFATLDISIVIKKSEVDNLLRAVSARMRMPHRIANSPESEWWKSDLDSDLAQAKEDAREVSLASDPYLDDYKARGLVPSNYESIAGKHIPMLQFFLTPEAVQLAVNSIELEKRNRGVTGIVNDSAIDPKTPGAWQTGQYDGDKVDAYVQYDEKAQSLSVDFGDRALSSGMLLPANRTSNAEIALDELRTYYKIDPDGRYAIVFTARDTPVAGADQFSGKSDAGRVSVLIYDDGGDIDSLMSDIFSSLYLPESDSRPASLSDAKKYFENIVLTLFEHGGDNFIRNLYEPQREEILKRLKSNLKIDIDDMSFTVSDSGFVSPRLGMGAAVDLATRTDVVGFSHNIWAYHIDKTLDGGTEDDALISDVIEARDRAIRQLLTPGSEYYNMVVDLLGGVDYLDEEIKGQSYTGSFIASIKQTLENLLLSRLPSDVPSGIVKMLALVDADTEKEGEKVASGSLLSSYERHRAKIGEGAGASTLRDSETGGSRYVFLNPTPYGRYDSGLRFGIEQLQEFSKDQKAGIHTTKKDFLKEVGNVLINLFAGPRNHTLAFVWSDAYGWFDVASRADAWANVDDEYGLQLSSGRKDILGGVTPNSYEYMVESNMPLSSANAVRVGFVEKLTLIEYFKSLGVVSINGVPLERFFAIGRPALDQVYERERHPVGFSIPRVTITGRLKNVFGPYLNVNLEDLDANETEKARFLSEVEDFIKWLSTANGTVPLGFIRQQLKSVVIDAKLAKYILDEISKSFNL